MPLHKYILLSVALLSFVTEVRAQKQSTCTASITVADTIFVPDPSAAGQWVSVGCSDTLRLSLTTLFNQANLFHWQQPGFVRSHTAFDTRDSYITPKGITLYIAQRDDYLEHQNASRQERDII